MSVNNVTTQSGTGVDGNSVTNAISNDQLTNQDFLRLMLEEMKMQDPTKPMDSQALMDSQLKMSQIESNQSMVESVTALREAYAASALSSASSMLGKIVEDGTQNDKGLLKSYKVETVESKDGELYVNAREITGLRDALVKVEEGKENVLVVYNPENGTIVEDGEDTEYKVKLDKDGRFERDDKGNITILTVEDNEVVTDQAILDKYKPGQTFPVYAENTTKIPVSNITEVMG